MTLRALTAAALVAVSLGAAATPALANTVTVMGLSFQQSDRAPAAAPYAHGYNESRPFAR